MNASPSTAQAEGAGAPGRAAALPLDLEHLIRRVTEVPTLPSTVAKILDISADDNSSAADLAKVIYFDQSLTAKVLRIANSSFYGFSRKVKTLEHATVILGFRDIRNMALAMSVFGSFFAQTSGTRFDRTRFWEHSLSSGLAAKVIADELGMNKTELFVAGLIHDLGKVILDRYHQDGFLRVLAAASGRGLTWEVAEVEVLGYTHADVGKRLLDVWKFPPELARPVGYHHHPWEDDREAVRSAAVYLADTLTRSQGSCDYEGQPQPGLDDLTAALGRAAEVGLVLPVSFLARFGARLKGEADGMQSYLDCMITYEMT